MKEQDKYKSLLVIVLGFSIIALVFSIKYLLEIGLAIGVISLIIPRVGDFILVAWEKFGNVLGTINATIILSVIFFVILLPVALTQRILGGQKNKASEKQNSSFHIRDHSYTKLDFEKPW